MTPEREGFWVFSDCRVSKPAMNNGDISFADEAEVLSAVPVLKFLDQIFELQVR